MSNSKIKRVVKIPLTCSQKEFGRTLKRYKIPYSAFDMRYTGLSRYTLVDANYRKSYEYCVRVQRKFLEAKMMVALLSNRVALPFYKDKELQLEAVEWLLGLLNSDEDVMFYVSQVSQLTSTTKDYLEMLSASDRAVPIMVSVELQVSEEPKEMVSRMFEKTPLLDLTEAVDKFENTTDSDRYFLEMYSDPTDTQWETDRETLKERLITKEFPEELACIYSEFGLSGRVNGFLTIKDKESFDFYKKVTPDKIDPASLLITDFNVQELARTLWMPSLKLNKEL